MNIIIDGSPSGPLCIQMTEDGNIKDVMEEVAERTGLKRHLLKFRHRGRYVSDVFLAVFHIHRLGN
jgi:hypothetical protein